MFILHGLYIEQHFFNISLIQIFKYSEDFTVHLNLSPLEPLS